MSDFEYEWNQLLSTSVNERTHHREVKQILSHMNFDFFIDCGVGGLGSEAWSVRDLTDAKIIGFEPQHERYERLIKNNYPAPLEKKAVGENVGEISGLMGYKGGKSDFWMHGDESLIGREYKRESVQVTTIDKILEETNYQNVFIWADIEGSELSMLKGAKKSLEKGLIVGLNLELRDHRASAGHCTAKEVIDFLSEYQIESLTDRFIISGSHKDFIFKRKKG